MGLTAKKSGGGKRITPEAGNQIGRCVSIIDLGTQHWVYQNQANSGHKVLITWELPEAVDPATEKMPVFDEAKGPQPFVVSQEYTVSINPKSKLRPLLESWMGRKFTAPEEEELDLKKFLNKICLVNVVHTPDKKDASNFYANVGGVTPPLKGMKCIPAINPLVSFEIGQADQFQVFETLHDFVKKKIEASDEWKEQMNGSNQGSRVSVSNSDDSDDAF